MRPREEMTKNRFGARCYWSIVAQAIKHLRIVLRVELRASGDGGVDIYAAQKGGELACLPRRWTTSRLKALLHDHYFACLVEQPSQGATIECISLDKASSKWIYTGEGVRFRDYPFAHRARLGLLSLRNRPFGPSLGISECRACGTERETPSHVLSRCPANKGGMCRRHDAVVSRLVGSLLDARKEEGLGTGPEDLGKGPLSGLEADLGGGDRRYLDKSTPDAVLKGEPQLQPDLVLLREKPKEAVILHVAVAFESGGPEYFVEKRESKKTRYAEIANRLARGGYRVTSDSRIVGALGSWDPANWRGLVALGIDRHSGREMARCSYTAALGWSATYIFNTLAAPKP